jgi:DNA-binding transcriptional LysR family regulator
MDAPLNLRQLQHLLLLAEELHFVRAADRAFLSQSAFSRSIQGLENAVGLRLFDRGLRHVRTTPVGAQFVIRARRLLSNASDLSRELALLRSGDLGDVSVGAGPFSGITLMPGPLSQIQREHPNIHVRLDVSDWRTLLKHLDEENIDFFIAEMRELPPREDCSIQRIGGLTGALYCRTNHPLASQPALQMTDLQNYPFASVHMPDAIKQALNSAMGFQDSSEFSLAVECESIAILRDLTLRSDIILLAPPNAVQLETNAGLLQRLAIKELDAMGVLTPLHTEFGIVRLKERTMPPASELLMNLVKKEASKILGTHLTPSTL